ncbi:MAG: replication factor C small subunit [bacterium ADurb.Bin236]|nr:MAG: replication factor C small subunit [bacterium ADurb.Bin236]
MQSAFFAARGLFDTRAARQYNEKMNETSQKIQLLISNIERVFVGGRDTVELSLIALFCGGHLLIVDLPGVGKTTLAKAIARSIQGKTKRAQFTPDLLPADITGVNIYIHQKGCFEFHPGPVFCNILLADEINRATPRAQSSLLEAMEEFQVSVDGVTHKLEQPFMVIATQNPVEIQGTFPLPEAQLDRFLISAAIGYPSRADEARILNDRAESDPLDSLEPVMTLEDVERVKKAVSAVHLSEPVKNYALDIAAATRDSDEILLGASPRATLALARAARCEALFRGRDFVAPEDVKAVAASTLAHRIALRSASRLNLERNRAAVSAIVDRLPAPRPG